jgi:hypothetical protein
MKTSEEETEEIKRLEAIPTKDMSELERIQHFTQIKDAYWRRRRAWSKEQGEDPGAAQGHSAF